MNRIPEVFGENYRKFTIALLAYFGNVLVLWLGMISGEVYGEVTIGVIGLYMAGNVGEYWARGRRGYHGGYAGRFGRGYDDEEEIPEPIPGPYPDGPPHDYREGKP